MNYNNNTEESWNSKKKMAATTKPELFDLKQI